MFVHAHTQAHWKGLQRRKVIFIPGSTPWREIGLVSSKGVRRLGLRSAPSAHLLPQNTPQGFSFFCALETLMSGSLSPSPSHKAEQSLLTGRSPTEGLALPCRASISLLLQPQRCWEPHSPRERQRVPGASGDLPWVLSSPWCSHSPLHKPALLPLEVYTIHPASREQASWGSPHPEGWADLPNPVLTPPSDNTSLSVAQPRCKLQRQLPLHPPGETAFPIQSPWASCIRIRALH